MSGCHTRLRIRIEPDGGQGGAGIHIGPQGRRKVEVRHQQGIGATAFAEAALFAAAALAGRIGAATGITAARAAARIRRVAAAAALLLFAAAVACYIPVRALALKVDPKRFLG